jgi:hypothetical protein
MKISPLLKRRNTMKKKTRPAYRPKIRWELLGLSNPDMDDTETSIETIRKEVSSLATLGFALGTRSRSTNQGPKFRDKGHANSALSQGQLSDRARPATLRGTRVNRSKS